MARSRTGRTAVGAGQGAEPMVQAGDQPPAPPVLPRQHVVRRTRIGGVWAAAALFAVVLLLLLIFILENGQRVSISYFGAHGHLPVGVALLLAAGLGVLLVVIPGTARIIQLRITAHRHRRADAQAATAAAAPRRRTMDGSRIQH
jgi:lipopolysaccharide assembly protein A